MFMRLYAKKMLFIKAVEVKYAQFFV